MKNNYNGWANYETWLFNLWYGDYLHETVEELREEAKLREENEIEYGTVYYIVNGFIDQILEDANLGNGFLSDAIGYVIQKVDVHEIAENLLLED